MVKRVITCKQNISHLIMNNRQELQGALGNVIVFLFDN